ncbi:MAG: sulfate/molybdate ABC transporter ATP-binding protein [Eggerthellaceae bacterium]
MSLQARIKKDFGSFSLDVDFQTGDGVFGLLGASGCGKSLIMRCIAGVEKPDGGRIVVNGTVFFDSEEGINLTPQQRKTALLFQNYMLFPNLTVEQNVAAGIDPKAEKAERARIVEDELARFDLGHFRKRYPSQLSGGQQQRVALARMLAARPQILMLDEPFSALDSHLKGLLEQNLAGLFDEFSGTVLYVSHDIDEALRFCDSIAVVDNGRIRQIGAGREVVDRPSSLAALKLSGCKNVTDAERTGPNSVYCPRWGVELVCAEPVPEGVRYAGVRAFRIEQVSEPGENVFRMRVDRASDSRFDRTVILGFLDCRHADGNKEEWGSMHSLHQSLIWRIDLLQEREFPLPQAGDEVLVYLRPDRIYLACE